MDLAHSIFTMDFLSDLLMFMTAFFLTVYIYFKAMNIKFSAKDIVILAVASILFIPAIVMIGNFNTISAKMIFLVFTGLTLILLHKNISLYISLPTSIISFGINYCIQFVSALICACVIWIVNYREMNFITASLTLILQIIISVLLMNIRRFRNGFSFLRDKNNFGMGMVISGFVIMFVCVGSQEEYFSDSFYSALLIGIMISAIGLFVWIRKSITQHYRKKLGEKTEEHYNSIISEKEEEINRLASSNAFLASVVHRDNHLMSSLKCAIEKGKSCGYSGEKLADEILTLVKERGELILNEQNKNKVLPSTGNALIDGAMCNMLISATAHNIDFNLVVSCEIHYLVNNVISQTNLETLLCDHIKNAIIAIGAEKNVSGRILVAIANQNGIYEISIKDNGIDFEMATLAKLGLERATSHSDEGGNGIGFMTTFETIKKAGASLIITEYKERIPFTKSVTFRFDGENKFIINSYRKDELLASIRRDDLIIV